MKIDYFVISLLLLLGGLSHSSYGQKCHEYYKSRDCNAEDYNEYKISSLSRGHYLEVGKTVTYEVVLYGQKEIIIACCTEEKYYPLRFKLKSSISGEVIFDNKFNNYINTISLSLDRTELISIEISFVSTNENRSVLKGTKACIGLAIYMEKIKVRQ